MKIIAEKNLILVKGAIPGANGDDVIVRTAIKGQWALPTPPSSSLTPRRLPPKPLRNPPPRNKETPRHETHRF